MNRKAKDLHRYDDMLDLPHYRSEKRPHMSEENRAAQFASFAALTGFEEQIEEAGKQVESYE